MGIDVANGPFPTLPLPCDCSGRGLASPTTAVAGNLICLDKVFFSSHWKVDRKKMGYYIALSCRRQLVCMIHCK